MTLNVFEKKNNNIQDIQARLCAVKWQVELSYINGLAGSKMA